MFSFDNYEGFGGGAPAVPGVARSSPARRNALLVALFFVCSVGFSLTFERALATMDQHDDPGLVLVAGV